MNDNRARDSSSLMSQHTPPMVDSGRHVILINNNNNNKHKRIIQNHLHDILVCAEILQIYRERFLYREYK